MSASPTPATRLTAPQLRRLKEQGRKIVMITAYDYPMASLADQSAADVILVGDSLGMVVQGRENTLRVTLDQMIYHAEMVSRAVRRAMVVVDLPFPINQARPGAVVDDAARVLKETDSQAVKIEGGKEAAVVIEALTTAGIPTMGHVGLRPQSVHQLGGFRVQRDLPRLVEDARAAESAGAFAIVVECVPAQAAVEITASVSIPTIGIGAGGGCDGQVLVLHDLLGLTTGRAPKFAKQYADLGTAALQALRDYGKAVREGGFPAAEHEFH